MKPQSVRSAAEAVDRQIQAMKDGATDGDAANNDNAAQDAEANSEPAPAAADETPSDAAAPAAASADDVERLEAELAKSTQRYKSLEGMFRAQNQQIDQYKAQMTQLQEQLDAAANSTPPAAPEPAVSQDDVRLFGEDLVSFVQRASKAAAHEAVDAIRTELSDVRKEVSSTAQQTQQSAQARFESQLDASVPTWRELDTDPAFIEWLQNNAAIHRGFNASVSSLDAKAVASVFELYTSLTATPKSDSAKQRKQELAAQVAPPKGKQGTKVTDPPADEWTRSEIEQVYRTRRGRNGEDLTPEQFAALEREIALAQVRGQVDFSR